MVFAQRAAPLCPHPLDRWAARLSHHGVVTARVVKANIQRSACYTDVAQTDCGRNCSAGPLVARHLILFPAATRKALATPALMSEAQSQDLLKSVVSVLEAEC